MAKPLLHIRPWYGKFKANSLPALIDRLEMVANRHFPGQKFHAFVIDPVGEKKYGLDLNEWENLLAKRNGDFEIAAASISSGDGRVFRISLRPVVGRTLLDGQFLIAGKNESENQDLQKLINSVGEEIIVDRHPLSRRETIQQIAQPRWIEPFGKLNITYRKPTITLFDQFYFRRSIEADQLLTMLRRISNEFLDGDPFLMRLETTEGDFHLNMDARELQYFFRFRRENLLLLYLDAATADGQWVNLRLSFHPLELGPNAEMEVTSFDVDGILGLIQEYLLVEDQLEGPGLLHDRFRFQPNEFSIQRTCSAIQDVARDHLQRIPPVAFLSTTDGYSYTGLSLFQLQKVWKQHQKRVSVLSLGLTKILTGQTMSLMFQFDPTQKASFASLSIMWGDEQKHLAVRDQLQRTLNFTPFSYQEIPAQKKPVSRQERFGFLALSWELGWSQKLEDALVPALAGSGFTVLTRKAGNTSEGWERAINDLAGSDFMIADLSYQPPEVLKLIAAARTLGLRVWIICQERGEIPAEFQDLPVLRYRPTIDSLTQLVREINTALTQN